MERIKLNIPSKFSHSRFMVKVRDDGETKYKNLNLKETDINYFYSIIYLYRLELLRLNENCLSKEILEDEEKTENYLVVENQINFNEMIPIQFYKIFSMIYGEGHNSQYDNFENFVERFKDVYVETNLFGKDKSEKSKMIKVFNTLKIEDDITKTSDGLSIGDDGISMNVRFSKEYILPYVVTEKYFKRITLNILYLLGSKYSKLLYLLLKDYVGVKFSTDTKTISKFLGESYNNTKINSYIRSLNQLDIHTKIGKPKFGKKSEKLFTISSQKYFIDENEEYEYNLKQFIWKECEIITNQIIDDRKIIVDNFEVYTKGIFKNKWKNEKLKYEIMFDLHSMVERIKEDIKSSVDENKKNPNIIFKMKDVQLSGNNYAFVIDDDYRLVEFPYPKIVTSTPQLTAEYFGKHFDSDNEEENIFIGYLDVEDNPYRLSSI